MNIYVLIGDREEGPYRRSEIFALMKAGTLGPDTPGRLELETEWKPLDKVLSSGGGLALLTPQQIAERQESLPAAEAPSIPHLGSPRRVEVPPVRPKGRFRILAGSIVALGIFSAWLVFVPPHPDEPSAHALSAPSPPRPPSPPSPGEAKAAPPLVAAGKSPPLEPISRPEKPAGPSIDPSPPPIANSPPAPKASGTPPARLAKAVDEPIKAKKIRKKRLSSKTSDPAGSKASKVGNPAPDPFFTVGAIRYLQKPPKAGPAVFKVTVDENKQKTSVFVPCLEVELKTQKQSIAKDTFAKIYFFDKNGRKLTKRTGYGVDVAWQARPSSVLRPGDAYPHPMPPIFRKETWESVFFEIPETVRKTAGWQAVVVFGDAHAANAKAYPGGNYAKFAFTERRKVDFPERVEREAALDPVIDYVLKTGNPSQPQITFFIRPPIGMTDLKEAKGVLAICALGNTAQEIKRRLQTLSSVNDDTMWLYRFSEKHRLVILCWGSRQLWDPNRNWDELSKAELRSIDQNFDQVARAWANGVEALTKKYEIPNRGFLLTGVSAAAQYALRLALRQPQFFKAVFVHMPSSFDRPTVEGSQLLWCLTIGERDSGYQRSLKFYQQCRELNYPMIFKGIIGLGHTSSKYSEKLGETFFEWALRTNPGKDSKARFSGPLHLAKPFPIDDQLKGYQHPLYVGDAVNQEKFPWQDRALVPQSFRVPLPDQVMAEAWALQHP